MTNQPQLPKPDAAQFLRPGADSGGGQVAPGGTEPPLPGLGTEDLSPAENQMAPNPPSPTYDGTAMQSGPLSGNTSDKLPQDEKDTFTGESEAERQAVKGLIES